MHSELLRIQTEQLQESTNSKQFFDLATEINLTGLDINLSLAKLFHLSSEVTDDASNALLQSANALYQQRNIRGLTTDQRFQILHFIVNNIGRSGEIQFRTLQEQLKESTA